MHDNGGKDLQGEYVGKSSLGVPILVEEVVLGGTKVNAVLN